MPAMWVGTSREVLLNDLHSAGMTVTGVHLKEYWEINKK